MAVVQVRAVTRYLGLSTDTKPVSAAPGSTFIETDTRTRWIYTGAAWSVMP